MLILEGPFWAHPVHDDGYWHLWGDDANPCKPKRRPISRNRRSMRPSRNVCPRCDAHWTGSQALPGGLGPTVFIGRSRLEDTDSRGLYHKKAAACRIKGNAVPVPLQFAVVRGMTPCPRCNPPKEVTPP